MNEAHYNTSNIFLGKTLLIRDLDERQGFVFQCLMATFTPLLQNKQLILFIF